MDQSEHIKDLAKILINNHNKFQCFGWSGAPEDRENWCLVYTRSRDSGILELSNASVIEKALEDFDEDECVAERHNHWACGWVEGYAIRVYKLGTKEVTKAFAAYAELKLSLDEYPILDEADYSEREYEATIKAIGQEGPSVEKEGWESEVYSWLSEHESSELESLDEHGPFPSKEAIERALEALGIS